MGVRTDRPPLSAGDTRLDRKLYYTVEETATLCRVDPPTLRFWERTFAQLKPQRRGGGRRYYQKEDIHLILMIRKLRYEQGFTISEPDTILLGWVVG